MSMPPPLSYATPQGVMPQIYSQNGLLVTPSRCDLGPQCIKCAAAGVKQHTKKFQWLHPAFALLVLMGVLLYLIVFVILNKKAVVTFMLCAEHEAKRKRGLLIGWLCALAGLLVLVGSIVLLANLQRNDSPAIGLIGIGTSIVLMIGGIIVGSSLARTVFPKRVDATTAWLGGVNAATFDVALAGQPSVGGRGFAVEPMR